MKVDNLNIKFNKSGKCGIIIAANDVDKTGSRFVENKLHPILLNLVRVSQIADSTLKIHNFPYAMALYSSHLTVNTNNTPIPQLLRTDASLLHQYPRREQPDCPQEERPSLLGRVESS